MRVIEEIDRMYDEIIDNLTISILELRKKFKDNDWVSFFEKNFANIWQNLYYIVQLKWKRGIDMIDEKILLTANDILEKEFKIDARGYRPQEVDKFLDIIIRDYTEYDKLLHRYETELKSVLAENAKLKSELRNLRSTLSVAESNGGQTNLDILRRLSELEKIVYGDE